MSLSAGSKPPTQKAQNMTANTKTCHTTKFGNIITCQGRMMYPSFFKPNMMKGETDPSKAKYQGTLIFPKGFDLKLLIAAVEAAAVDRWTDKYKEYFNIKKPFGKASEQAKMSGTAEDYPIFIRTSSRERPEVRSPSNGLITEEQSEEVYAGRWARFSVSPYAYDHPTGGKGVSIGLHSVQLLDHDERLAGARAPAEDEFSAVEGAEEGNSTDSLFD